MFSALATERLDSRICSPAPFLEIPSVRFRNCCTSYVYAKQLFQLDVQVCYDDPASMFTYLRLPPFARFTCFKCIFSSVLDPL